MVSTVPSYPDGETVGTVVGTLTGPESALRRWERETPVDGVMPHGATRFEALDAIVRGRLPTPRLARSAA
jgi:hypothetical protein